MSRSGKRSVFNIFERVLGIQQARRDEYHDTDGYYGSRNGGRRDGADGNLGFRMSNEWRRRRDEFEAYDFRDDDFEF